MAHKLTSKGQVTVPRKIREHLGVCAGDAVDFRIGADGAVRILPVSGEIPAPPANRFAALRGRATIKLSTDEIMRLTRGHAPDLDESAATETP